MLCATAEGRDLNITLHPNAVFYFALKRTATLTGWVFLITLFTLNKMYAKGLTIGSDAAVSSTSWHHILAVGGFIAFILLFFSFSVLCVYFYLLARSYKLDLREDGLAMNYGVFRPRAEVMPFSKIQEIMTNRNILEQLLGLSSLIIKVVGGKPKKVNGLGPAAATDLRQQILTRLQPTAVNAV
jgi:membrane protein YdbS with pleckstrin-like domain